MCASLWFHVREKRLANYFLLSLWRKNHTDQVLDSLLFDEHEYPHELLWSLFLVSIFVFQVFVFPIFDISLTESILIFREYLFGRTCFLLVSNIQRHKFFFSDENSSAHWNSAAYVLVRRNYVGKSPVNIKCHNLYFFKEGKRGKYLICIAQFSLQFL